MFFINNKLTVIAISTTATPRPGKVPSHAGPCNRRAPSCARRSALPRAQGSKPGASLTGEGAKAPSPALASLSGSGSRAGPRSRPSAVMMKGEEELVCVLISELNLKTAADRHSGSQDA